MKQYIDKAAVVAEIEKLKEEYALCPTRNNYEDGLKEGRLIGYKDALNKINTLGVKEVGLEKEISRVSKNEYFDFTDWKSIARHFFELGLNAQKGEYNMTKEEKEQFKQDVEMLMELAFDGTCVGQYELDLLERIRTRLKELW